MSLTMQHAAPTMQDCIIASTHVYTSAVIAVQVYKTEGPRPTPQHNPLPDPPLTSSLLPVLKTLNLRDIAHRSRALLGSKSPPADGERSSKTPATQRAEEQDGKKQLSLSVCRSAVKTAPMGSWICLFLFFTAYCSQHRSLCASAKAGGSPALGLEIVAYV